MEEQSSQPGSCDEPLVKSKAKSQSPGIADGTRQKALGSRGDGGCGGTGYSGGAVNISTVFPRETGA